MSASIMDMARRLGDMSGANSVWTEKLPAKFPTLESPRCFTREEMIPAPVKADCPKLQAAREAAASVMARNIRPSVMAGAWDDEPEVQSALAAINAWEKRA
ncbi:hypothetical protein WJS89_10410 [Sphingomicrobium sp. XHP0235]|uniref:hypothetical protein n=1 Tax=Sphingomicrobium aquimarinum TaxID=3133971 RepID=UPI0031FF1BC9